MSNLEDLGLDEFFTVRKPAENEIKIKGSRFIGFASPASSPDEAQAFIQKIVKRHHDATHHAFGYRIGHEARMQIRSSDAGEPSGTAGKPILDALDGRNLMDTICVVTRYFGGIKLGTGGLSRAYGLCAAQTLDKAGKQCNVITDRIGIQFEYSLTGSVMSAVDRYKCMVENSNYGEKTDLVLSVRRSRASELRLALIDMTAGKIVFMDEKYDP